eukprot:CAMPEP_0168565562 /NCGR_PEP_ID=MMETSP0413-20121227/13915_1 /TAXON_ID=136452 /ORGANISM="Filamoeba nolandi, Strain NC-AS-23-1" /LENGTH=225 /DNA_ID=CAMNT_0008597449 /DNA_START=140 /DNA_END=817 /DNA_ORIENTATION=-
MEVEEAVVIHNGSHCIQAGFAGDDSPRAVFPNLVGRPRNTNIVPSIQNMLIGDAAMSKRGLLTLTYPVKEGYIVNWEDMEKIWEHTLNEELRIPPEEAKVLLTEPPLNPEHDREKMIEIMLEHFHTPAAFIAVQQVLSLYAAGKCTGVVVDCGYEVFHTVPIIESRVQNAGVQKASVGGKDLTFHLRKILYERNTNLVTPSEQSCRGSSFKQYHAEQVDNQTGIQ